MFRKSYSKGRFAKLQLKALALSIPLPCLFANRSESLPATLRKSGEPPCVAFLHADLELSQGVAEAEGLCNEIAWTVSAPISLVAGS
jgi:hypothetical protein